jgi:hypothetical protein
MHHRLRRLVLIGSIACVPALGTLLGVAGTATAGTATTPATPATPATPVTPVTPVEHEDPHTKPVVIVQTPAQQTNPVVVAPSSGGSTSPGNTSNSNSGAPINIALTSPSGGNGANGATNGSSTPSSSSHSSGGSADLTGPVMIIGYAGISSSGQAKIRVECPDYEQQFCSGSLRLIVKLHGRDITIGTASFSHIDGGSVRIVKVRLSRSARRNLRKAGGLNVKTRAHDAAGNIGTTNPYLNA